MTPLHFHKYHGLGNDYLVCHRAVADQLSNEHIRILCHRHYGVGSDGLLIDSGDRTHPTLRIINPDGSEAEKSGNGLRIYARYLFDIGRVGHEPFLVHTAGGDVYCTVERDFHQISVDMGRANFNPAALPALVNLPEAVNYPLPLADETLSVVLVSMGNPHCVVFCSRVDGVDVFVGGHTHSLLSNTNPKAVGPYPIVKHSPSGEPVLVVTAASSCKLLGHIAIDFNDAGTAQRWNGEPIVLDGRNVTVPPDAKLSARLDSYAAQLRSLIGQPVGKILLAGDTSGRQVDLEEDAHLCRVQECPSGDVLMDSLLWGARDTGATVALSVGGTVRSPLHTGVVTMGDLLATMPFDNTLVVGDLTGKQLLGALEHGASGYENGAGRFLQVAGLTYSVEPAKPVGQRVSAVSVRTKAGGWEPLRPEAVYRVATVDYAAEGGDGFAAFKKIKWQYTGRAHIECLRDYIAKAPVEVRSGGRITVLR